MRVFSEVDGDQGGLLSHQEFATAMALSAESEHFIQVRWSLMQFCFKTFESQNLSQEAFVQRLAELTVRQEDAVVLWAVMPKSDEGFVSMHEFMHGMAVEGSEAADPRVLIILRCFILRAVYWHLDTECDLKVDRKGFLKACIRAEVDPVHAEEVFKEMDRQRQGFVSLTCWCQDLALSTWRVRSTPALAEAYDHVKRRMFNVAFDALQVPRHKSVDLKELMRVLFKIGMTRKDVTNAFLMLDTEHTGVMTMDDLIRGISS